MWQAHSEALPTKENLKKRKILEHSRCIICSMAQESTLHAIWSREFLQKIWFLGFEWILKDFLDIHYFHELVQLIGQQQR